MGFIADEIEIHQNFGEPKKKPQSGGVIPSGSGKTGNPEGLLGEYTVPGGNYLTEIHVKSYSKVVGLYGFTNIMTDGRTTDDTVADNLLRKWIEDGQIVRKT